MSDLPPYAQRVFAEHGVPDKDRLFLFCAFDRLLEEDVDHADIGEAAAQAVLSADSYEELLQQHNRGHRRNKTWLRSEAFSDAVPTRKGRAMLMDFAALTSQEKTDV